MRAFVTGAGGFVGGALAAALRRRGDEVRAIVREPGRADTLADLGCEVVSGDLAHAQQVARTMAGCDAVFHVAGAYRVGIAGSERPRMYASNVAATAVVLAAAADAGVSRTVYVSTINVFGNTRGQIVDETYRRDVTHGFLSYYDETKYLAHLEVEAHAARGEPVVIAMPGQVYGRGDHSAVGRQLADARQGRLRAVAFGETGLNFVHVDDLALGMLLVHDRGEDGRSYVLGGEILRLRQALAVAARLGGHALPRLCVPASLMRALAPLGSFLGGRRGVPADVGEVVRAGDGVTYWATDARARRELGYAPRNFADGLHATYATPH